MKKYIIVLNVAIILFVVVKIMTLGGVLQASSAANTSTVLEKRQTAESSSKAAKAVLPAAVDAMDDSLAKPRDILTALEAKKRNLRKKNSF